MGAAGRRGVPARLPGQLQPARPGPGSRPFPARPSRGLRPPSPLRLPPPAQPSRSIGMPATLGPRRPAAPAPSRLRATAPAPIPPAAAPTPRRQTLGWAPAQLRVRKATQRPDYLASCQFPGTQRIGYFWVLYRGRVFNLPSRPCLPRASGSVRTCPGIASRSLAARAQSGDCRVCGLRA